MRNWTTPIIHYGVRLDFVKLFIGLKYIRVVYLHKFRGKRKGEEAVGTICCKEWLSYSYIYDCAIYFTI